MSAQNEMHIHRFALLTELHEGATSLLDTRSPRSKQQLVVKLLKRASSATLREASHGASGRERGGRGVEGRAKEARMLAAVDFVLLLHRIRASTKLVPPKPGIARV